MAKEMPANAEWLQAAGPCLGCETHHTHRLQKCVKYQLGVGGTKPPNKTNHQLQQTAKVQLIYESAAREIRICSEKILVSREGSDWQCLCLGPILRSVPWPSLGNFHSRALPPPEPFKSITFLGEDGVARFSKQKYRKPRSI